MGRFNPIAVFCVSLCLCVTIFWANDTEYYSGGNELVPLDSTQIRLDKEVLDIERDEGSTLYPFAVEVTYTLYNEGPPRRLLVGFEAPAPLGGEREENDFFYRHYDLQAKLRAEREAIRNPKYHLRQGSLVDAFQVLVNGKERPYQVADLSRLKSHKGSTPFVGELYYFTADFKHGPNTIVHRYRCQIASGSVELRYSLDYVLATARHWKGGRIGDFTLRLDMGNFEEFSIYPTFFDDLKHWHVPHGTVRMIDNASSLPDGTVAHEKYAEFFVRDGIAIFHEKGFVPRSGVLLESNRLHLFGYPYGWREEGEWPQIFTKDLKLSFLLCGRLDENTRRPLFAADLDSLRILQAFPYACRGAKFSDPTVAAYYHSLTWYRIDRDYDPSRNYPYGDYRRIPPGVKRWSDRLERFKMRVLRDFPFASRGAADPELTPFLKRLLWYRDDLSYRPLSSRELRWLDRILHDKRVGDEEFFALLKEYGRIMKGESNRSSPIGKRATLR